VRIVTGGTGEAGALRIAQGRAEMVEEELELRDPAGPGEREGREQLLGRERGEGRDRGAVLGDRLAP